MNILKPQNVEQLPPHSLVEYAIHLNWLLRMRTAITQGIGESYFQFQLMKVPSWGAAVVDGEAGRARDMADALAACGAQRFAALSIPFYLIDDGLFGYQGPASEDALCEITGEWGPFIYAIMGVAPGESDPVALILKTYEFVVFAGPERFLSRALGGDPSGQRAEFLAFAQADYGREELLSVDREVSDYHNVADNCAIIFPNL